STGDAGEESYRIFYLGANSTAGQSPVYFAGTGTSATPGSGLIPGNGCITTTPQNCKVIKYPSEIPETGTTNTSTGTITITAYLDPAGGVDFRTRLITSAMFNGKTVSFKGTGTNNNIATSFAITVQDKAEPGAGKDTFAITLGTGYSKAGTLQAGNIQVH